MPRLGLGDRCVGHICDKRELIGIDSQRKHAVLRLCDWQTKPQRAALGKLKRLHNAPVQQGVSQQPEHSVHVSTLLF